MVYVQFVGCCMLFILGFSIIDNTISLSYQWRSPRDCILLGSKGISVHRFGYM